MATCPPPRRAPGLKTWPTLSSPNVTLKDNSDGLLTGGSATTSLANTVLDNQFGNCTGIFPVDQQGNFATDFSPCGFAVNETGSDAKLGPESF